MQIDQEARKTAIVAYLSIIGTVIAMFMNTDPKREFASFHIRQALGLNLGFYILAYFVGYFDSWMVTTAFYVFFIVLWIYGFSSAVRYHAVEIPIVGRYFQDWFKNL